MIVPNSASIAVASSAIDSVKLRDLNVRRSSRARVGALQHDLPPDEDGEQRPAPIAIGIHGATGAVPTAAVPMLLSP